LIGSDIIGTYLNSVCALRAAGDSELDMKTSSIVRTPPSHRAYGLGAIWCALLLAACSDSTTVGTPNTVGGSTLTSITVSPSSASLGIGQSQTLTAEGKDQNGAAMTGLSFAWASSDSNVAKVSGGVVTGVAAGNAMIRASSGSVTSNAVSLTVAASGGAASRVVVDKASVLLAGVGKAAQLAAQIVDAQGAPVTGTVSWTSSAPGKVSVDAAGHLTANAIGSAQIFAAAGGARSTPTLVFVAEPQTGALLVTDAQVVSVGPPLDVTPGTVPGVGSQYEVTLRGVTAPPPGTVVLALETAPVAGKVVTTRQSGSDIVVTLALAPLYELLRSYDIALSIDLSAFPVAALSNPSSGSTLSAAWNAGLRGKLGRSAARARDDLEPFKAFKCDGSAKAKLASAQIQLSLDNQLTLILDDQPGYSKHALTGSAALVGSAGVKLNAGFTGSLRCDAQAQVKLPVFGSFSLFAMPAVRIGLGAEIEGQILVVQGELGVEGKVGVSPVLGWECGGAAPDCRALDNLAPLNEFKTKSKLPSLNGMQVKVSAQFYLLAGLDVSLLAGAFNAEILEARVGPEQSFNLAFEEDQIARGDYASDYDLKLKGVVEPGAALKDAIKKVINDDVVSATFKAEFSTDISESPKGTLSASTARVAPNKPVDFTVSLTAKTIDYWLLGNNVVGVQLYRRRDDETEFTSWKAMSPIASGNGTWAYRWVPTEAEAGKYEIAALVNTQIPTPLLEINPNSIQHVEVTCFSGGPGGGAARIAAHVASRSAPTCADRWDGTATLVENFAASPTAEYRTKSNLTFKYDSTSLGSRFYTGSGDFEVALADPTGRCSYAVTPSTFAILPDSMGSVALLQITDDGNTPPSYNFGVFQRVSFTFTESCPGESNKSAKIDGVVLPVAAGFGPFTAGQLQLSGTFDQAGIKTTWNLVRP
jgi:hypothetical protein